MLAQKVAVEGVVTVSEERLLAAVTALGHVVGEAWEDCSGEARQLRLLRSVDPAA
jgi:hypothetical protein